SGGATTQNADREGRCVRGDGAAAAIADGDAVEVAVEGGIQDGGGVAGRGGTVDGDAVEQPLVGEGAGAASGDREGRRVAGGRGLVGGLAGDGRGAGDWGVDRE